MSEPTWVWLVSEKKKGGLIPWAIKANEVNGMMALRHLSTTCSDPCTLSTDQDGNWILVFEPEDGEPRVYLAEKWALDEPSAFGEAVN